MRLWYTTGDVTALRELPRNRVVCLDVETTGLNPNTDEILQVALVRGDETVLLSSHVRPGRHVRWPAAQRVNGISPEMVAGRPSLSSLSQELERHLCGAALIVGYNVAIDLAFVRAAGISCGSAPVFDVMREFAPVVGRRHGGGRDYSWVSLERCARHYGIRFRAHDALEDARATLRCFWSMLECGPARGRSAAARSYLSVVADHASEKSCGGVQDE